MVGRECYRLKSVQNAIEDFMKQYMSPDSPSVNPSLSMEQFLGEPSLSEEQSLGETSLSEEQSLEELEGLFVNCSDKDESLKIGILGPPSPTMGRAVSSAERLAM